MCMWGCSAPGTAHRYGTSPRSPTPSWSSTTATKAGLPRLVFLLDTGAADVGIPLSALLDREFGSRQDAFRARVQEGGLVTGSFASPAVLGQLVERSLRKLAETDPSSGGIGGAWPSGVLLPAPLLDVQVRGRDDVVAELAELASVPDGRARVLAGMGAAGKSTVARAVAAQVRAGGGRAWWVPAADAVSLTQLLLGLAGALGASAGQVDEALAGRVNPSDVLWRQLEAAHGWMLVLDNADDLAALTVDGRSAGSGSGWLRPTRAGLVLVTSRAGDQQVWGPAAQLRQLEPLGEADGAQVLLDLAPAAGDRADGAEPVRAAGRAPAGAASGGFLPGVCVRHRARLRRL